MSTPQTYESGWLSYLSNILSPPLAKKCGGQKIALPHFQNRPWQWPNDAVKQTDSHVLSTNIIQLRWIQQSINAKLQKQITWRKCLSAQTLCLNYATFKLLFQRMLNGLNNLSSFTHGTICIRGLRRAWRHCSHPSLPGDNSSMASLTTTENDSRVVPSCLSCLLYTSDAADE